MNSHEYFSFLEAAEFCGTSRSKVWRATKQGDLLAEKRQKNGRAVWTVALDDLLAWAKNEGLSVQDEQSNTREQSRTVTSEHSAEQSFELHEQLLNRFEQAQRRAILLEMQLQQSQRLLCERNDDQHEREARAKEAEARAELAREEAEQAKVELERLRVEAEAKARAEEALELMAADLASLKTEMATKEAEWAEKRQPWYKKLFRKSS